MIIIKFIENGFHKFFEKCHKYGNFSVKILTQKLKLVRYILS